MVWLFLSFLLVLALAAGLAWWWGRRRLHHLGLPEGEVMYSDTAWRRWTRPLMDPELGLSGKPDYVVRLSEEVWVPVEVKSTPAPAQPYESHVYQLVAYALLLQRQLNKRVPYGYIRYADRTFRVEITPAMEARLMDLIAEIRDLRSQGREPGRSHASPARCRACGYRRLCPFRLE